MKSIIQSRDDFLSGDIVWLFIFQSQNNCFPFQWQTPYLSVNQCVMVTTVAVVW